MVDVQLPCSFSISETSTSTPTEVHDDSDQMDIDEEDMVCFGMLCDLKAQFYRTRGPALVRHITDALGESQEEWIPLNLSLEETYCGLSTLSHHLIAVLNKKSSAGLANLLQVADGVRYLSYAQQAQLQGGLEKLQSTTGNVQFDLNIMVVGPQSESDEVARSLSEHSLYLQEPYFMLEQYPYHNPQYLDIKHHEEQDPPSKERCMDHESQDRNTDTSEPSHLELILAAIDNLPENVKLGEARVDSRIQTPLLEHQSKATSFIIGREKGDNAKFTSLWEETSGEHSPIYQHLITGSKSPSPDDIPGGLLADEMGLGKTLSMISAIVTTLSCADSYAKSNQRSHSGITSTPSTLVIVPSSLLLEGWVEEIEKHVHPGVITHYKYHGPDRRLDPSNLPSVVISTYGTVTTELSRANSILKQIHWYRLVLDEAHIIRNWSTKQFRAMNSLSSHIRWCMTGTPVQNGVGDIGSLVRFLRVPVLGDAATFRKHILEKTKLTSLGSSNSDFENLRLVLSSICLRRNTSVLQLPGVKYEYRRPGFSTSEKEAHTKLILACQKAIDRSVFGNPDKGVAVQERPGLDRSNGALESLLRLRLFCDQGLALGPPKGGLPSTLDEALSFLQQKGISRCGDCGSEVNTDLANRYVPGFGGIHLTNCHMLVCSECITKFHDDLLGHGSSNGVGGTCSFCRQYDDGENLLPGQQTLDPKTMRADIPCPSKLQVLMEDLCKTTPHEKSIVFSFWMKSLDLVENLLKKEQIDFRRVDGSRSKNDRRASLHDFRTTNVPVLLMTFGTGSMGLNDLNVARRVHILEPQWNPSVENQAIGRVSRYGQTREVTVIRYVMKKSIEEAVESRQFLKLNLALKGGLHEGKGTNPKGQQASLARRIASDLQEFLTQLMM
ncbi:SNF2 family N-terminal domain-containing protein [Cercophora samala]|uniref:SNF2 family N-terminal domain-containing protein n=1 Tax=Cercophora samala TaxID=330535 RepID=A0AA39YN79_9PEZI|nr:SNF2 family N-terminal domain-containing protein [Cercophora samala]